MKELKKVFPYEDSNLGNVTSDIQTKEAQTVVFVKGFRPNDILSFEINIGDECTPCWVPLNDCCGTVKIEYPQTFIVMPIPLNYRGILTNSNDEHLNDASWFDDVEVKYLRLDKGYDLTKFYHGCCSN